MENFEQYFNEDFDLEEAYDFKDLAAKKAFNFEWKPKFNELLVGNKICYVVVEKTSTSRLFSVVEKVFVGANTGDIFVKTTKFGTTPLTSFKEYGYKKPHFEAGDEEATNALLALIAEYNEAFHTAAKTSNGDTRSLEYSEDKFEDQVGEGQDLSQKASTDLKDWLALHVTNVKFTLPDLNLIPNSEKRVKAKNELTFSLLEKQYPGITSNAKHFGWETKTLDNAIFSFWGLTGFTYFDVPFEEFPEELKTLVIDAKDKSLKRGQTNVRPSKPTDKVINNIYFAHAIIDMFDGDYTFCDRNIDAEAIADSDDTFKQDFDNINAYGEKVESLREAKEEICCICGEPIEGYGNNPEPYKHEGRCCDACNAKFVIPARLAELDNKE